MSIFMALTGNTNPVLRVAALMLSSTLLACALASGKIELIALHGGLFGLHIKRLAADRGRGGPCVAPA